MDATTSRRIGNIILALAILILLVAIGGKYGFLPQIVRLREIYILVLVLVIVARVLRRRGRDLRPGA